MAWPGFDLTDEQYAEACAVLPHADSLRGRLKVLAELVDWTDQATQADAADDYDGVDLALETRKAKAREAVIADDPPVTPLVAAVRESNARALAVVPVDAADMDRNARFTGPVAVARDVPPTEPPPPPMYRRFGR
jgi:hypothetical protein